MKSSAWEYVFDAFTFGAPDNAKVFCMYCDRVDEQNGMDLKHERIMSYVRSRVNSETRDACLLG